MYSKFRLKTNLLQSYLDEFERHNALTQGVQLKVAHEVDTDGFLEMDGGDLNLLTHYKGDRGLDALYHRYSYKPQCGGKSLIDY